MGKLLCYGSVNYFQFIFEFAVTVVAVYKTHYGTKNYGSKNQFQSEYGNAKLFFHQKYLALIIQHKSEKG